MILKVSVIIAIFIISLVTIFTISASYNLLEVNIDSYNNGGRDAYNRAKKEFLNRIIPIEIFLTRNEINDIISLNKDLFIDLYAVEVGNKLIANIIVDVALEKGVPVNAAFALCYNESKYDPNAIGYNYNGSVDRGLFQLNSSFHKEFDWFDPLENTKRGLETLKTIYDKVGTWEIALILFNSGSMGNTSKLSVYRIEEILKKEKELDESFNEIFRNTYNAKIYKEKK